MDAPVFLANFSERKLSFKPEIDIRGQRAEEAIVKIQEFIDEAIMFEVAQLTDITWQRTWNFERND